MTKTKQAPSIFKLNDLMECDWPQAEINGKWVMARPLGLDTIPNRFRCAWLVFTGRADALVWVSPRLTRQSAPSEQP
jgi:hypothetical protein